MTRTDSRAAVASAISSAGREPAVACGVARRARSVTLVLAWMIAVMPALQGCGFVAREHYFAPESTIRERMPIPGSGEGGAVIHASIGETRAVFESQGVHFTAGPDIREGKLILFGPLLPIIPGFVINWIGDEPKEVLTLVSFRITPGGRKVVANLDGITLKTSSAATPLLPRKYMVLAERSRNREESWITLQDWLPGESHRVDMAQALENSPPTFRVAVLYPFDAREPQSLEIEWGGLVIDGQEVAPFKAAFARHTGWMWGLVGP
jgi:hypothetical protein